MAESDEGIIVIDDDNVDGAKNTDDTDHHHYKEKFLNDANIKKLLIASVAVLISFIIIVVVLFALPSKKEEIKENVVELIEEKLKEEPKKVVKVTELENMIAKANYLYSTGSKNEALSIYEKIAQFSEAISFYNLGVAQLKNKQYTLALSTFKKAIQNDEKRCVSAINAAVCSLHLNDQVSFKYYIDLAYVYLSKEKDTKLYSYYYSLINYYNKNYFDVLSTLKHPSSDEYTKIQDNLSAKINAMFGNDYDAIEALENKLDRSDHFSLGLLYARVGDISLAKKYLNSSINDSKDPMKAKLALAYVNLKSGSVNLAASQIEEITQKYSEEVYKPYPIKVYLKEAVFDPMKAQKQYRKLVRNSDLLDYQKLFYFSPYKIFNASQTISYIRKGNANIFIDNVDSAAKFLNKGTSLSNVNRRMTLAIKKALNLRIREANVMFQELVKIQPKHSILQYDLALTYAQMGNIKKAQEHFLNAYHLDAKNYLYGIYSIMCSKLLDQDYEKLKSVIEESIEQEVKQDTEEIMLYKTLLHIVQDNTLAMVDWLDNNYKQRPLYLALDVIISLKLNKTDIAKKSVNKLISIQKNDILPHIMYIDANFDDLNAVKYARKAQNYFKNIKLKFDSLYFGPYITRYLYIQQNLITGKLYYLRQRIKKTLETTQENTQELHSALALASLYDGEFEESYTLYNNLIDNLKVRDAHTLFLAAVASVAASHHANAIALLELSKLKDKHFLETRYALGLLYLEVKNNQGATIQLSNIEKPNFNSGYFNFDIDLDILTFEKMHPNDKI